MKSFGKKTHPLGFIQVSPLPTPDELSHYYAETYYQNFPSTTYASTYSDDEVLYFDNRAKSAEWIYQTNGGKEPGSLLDVGCGEGFFPAYFLEKKWSVAACDFSDAGAQRQNPKLLPYFEKGNIYDILGRHIKSERKYDMINLASVLEHVIDPIELLQSIRKLLHSKSLLRIVVPNDYSPLHQLLLDRKLTEETWFSPPDHLNYFNGETFPKTLLSQDFKIKRVIADFPIESFLVNEHSNYWKDRKLGSAAHKTRITIDNMLFRSGIENYLNYMTAAAACSYGRTLTAFVSVS